MDEEEAGRVVSELATKKLFHDPKIEEFLKDKVKTGADWSLVFRKMAEADNIAYNIFMGNKMSLAFSDSQEFFQLLDVLASKDRNFFVLQPLIKCSESDPELAERIYNNISAGNEALVAASGYILGGIGLKQPDFLLTTISKGLDSADDTRKSSYLLALRVALGQNIKIEMPQNILDFILNTVDSGDISLRRETLQTIIALYDFDKARFKQVLLKIANNSDNDRGYLSFALSYTKLSDTELKLEILSICSDSKDFRVLENTAVALSYTADTSQKQCLEIVKKWARSRTMQGGSMRAVLIQGIADAGLENALKFVESWIEEEKDKNILRFDIPDIVVDLSEKHPQDLIKFIGSWNDKNDKFVDVLVKALERLLSDMYSRGKRDSVAIDKAYDILLELAARKSLDVDRAMKSLGIGDKLMKCLVLVDGLTSEPRPLDYNKIKANLALIPNVVQFVGKEWFDKKIREKNSSHPFMFYLSNMDPSLQRLKELLKRLNEEKQPLRKAFVISAIQSYVYPNSMLSHIEAALGMFQHGEQGTSRIVDGLRNPEEFFQTLSELEVAALLKKRYPVKLQEPINGVPADIVADINGRKCVLEVLSLDTGLELKYVRSVIGLGNRAKEKILDKIDRQIKRIAQVTTNPIILVIDKSRAGDIDEYGVNDALGGTLTWKMLIDKATGAVVDEYWERNRDSVSDLRQEGKRLSAVVLYKSDVAGDFKIKLFGEIIPNPYTNTPLDSAIIDKLKDCIFAKSTED